MRDRTLEGHWWLPGREDHKIAGILTYDGSEPSLRLLGAIRESDEQAPGGLSMEPAADVPLIRGACDGKAVTLLDCHERRFRTGLGGIDSWRQTLRARLMLVGVWLEEPEEQFFDRIVIGIDHLLPWSKESGLDRGFEQVDGRASSVTASWKQVESLTTHVEGASIQLRLSGSTGEDARAGRTVESITERAHLVVTVPGSRGAQDLITKWTKPFQDLLTLAMDTPCGLHDISLIRTKPAQPTPPDTDTTPAHPLVVEAYLAPLYRAQPDDKAVASHRALFTLKDLAFADLLPRWFKVMDRLGPVIGMLLGQRYMGKSFVENRLITAVAAAEGLHRRLLPESRYVSRAEFETMRTALIAAISPEHEEWLTSRLWNEPSLKQRLMQLVDRLGTEVVEPFMPRSNRWARAATDARNVLVHRFDVDEPEEPLTGPAMYALAELTAAVITLILLKEIGLDTSQLTRLTRQHHSFRWLREKAPEHLPKVLAR
ncbi:ApeA N-terminal domain 1-containing protein [Pseudonocardia adelaidensis]|uniref:ApeA N-terminal domain-containing protein n=1 Tax=Pseudonocardia adelaidensis TaxID=648754 RepID=A0ABP9NWF5_9PSEU